jgi:hypothetical protein
MVAAQLEFNGPVSKNESRTWTANMRVPPLSPSMLHSCSIIDLTYRLMVSSCVMILRQHHLTHPVNIIAH